MPRGVRAQGDDPRLGRTEALRRCPVGERPGRVRRDGEHRVGVPGLCGHRAVRDPHQARLEPLGVLLGQQVVHQHRDVHTGATQRPVEVVTVDPGVVPDRVQVEQHRSRGQLDPERHQRAVPCAPQDPATGTSQLRLDPGRDQHGHQRPAHPAEQRPTAGQGARTPPAPGPASTGVGAGGAPAARGASRSTSSSVSERKPRTDSSQTTGTTRSRGSSPNRATSWATTRWIPARQWVATVSVTSTCTTSGAGGGRTSASAGITDGLAGSCATTGPAVAQAGAWSGAGWQ